jgi:hypothetical protein
MKVTNKRLSLSLNVLWESRRGYLLRRLAARVEVVRLVGGGVPMAVARAAAPLLRGLMWSTSDGYSYGVWMLLIVSVIGVGALWSAQNNAQKI